MSNKLEGLNNYSEYEGSQILFTESYKNLPDKTKLVIQPQLIEAAAAGFHRPPEQFASDVVNHLQEGELYVVQTEGIATGFAVLQLFPDIDALYIAGIVKKKPAPSQVIEHIIKQRLQENGFNILGVRTQNDRVAEIMANICPLGRLVAVDRPALPREVDLAFGMNMIPPTSNLDPKNLILKKHFGGEPMIAGLPRRRVDNPRVTQYTDKLDYAQGDAALFIGYKK